MLDQRTKQPGGVKYKHTHYKIFWSLFHRMIVLIDLNQVKVHSAQLKTPIDSLNVIMKIYRSLLANLPLLKDKFLEPGEFLLRNCIAKSCLLSLKEPSSFSVQVEQKMPSHPRVSKKLKHFLEKFGLCIGFCCFKQVRHMWIIHT